MSTTNSQYHARVDGAAVQIDQEVAGSTGGRSGHCSVLTTWGKVFAG